MKSLFISLMFFISCNVMNEQIKPLPKPCELAHIEVNDSLAKLKITADIDTLYGIWEHWQYGNIPVFWTTEQFDCIGWNMVDVSMNLTIWNKNDTCELVIPSLTYNH